MQTFGKFVWTVTWCIGAMLLGQVWSVSVWAETAVCRHCGMKRAQFDHSWTIIIHSDGSVDEMCSIHCAAIDMAIHTDKPLYRITVADYFTQEQIPVDTAYWVIGGDRLGVMTTRGKWAFSAKADADRFIDAHGGVPADFDEVMEAAFEDMYRDTLMIRKKRQMMKLRDDAAAQ